MKTTNIDFSQRNVAIDILRGLTVLLMIFVNDFWSITGFPHWMGHAATNEDFLGLADVVYPIFLFVVGMSIPYAIEGRIRKGFSDASTALHIFSRTFALLIMGAFTEQTLAGMLPEVMMNMHVFKVFMVFGFFLCMSLKCLWCLGSFWFGTRTPKPTNLFVTCILPYR